MALVNLKDVRVSRLNSTGHGFTVVEETQSSGKTFKQSYKVWPKEDAGVREGDVISLSGFLGAKVNTWTDKDGQERHTVELSVNSPRIGTGAAQEGANGGFSSDSDTNTRSGVSTSQTGVQGNTSSSFGDSSDEVPF